MTAAGDPYSILGLEPGASVAEIKRAYRRLAKSLHPDSAGERSLPAFLAVQDAYERLTGTKVRTVRAPAGPTPARSADAGFREPWRADPARARAAREQARARRAGSSTAAGPGRDSGADAGAGRDARSGPGSAGTADPGPATDAGSASTSRSTSDQGTRASRSSRSSGHAGAAGDPGGRRRRATRKATMGSTSYDEARDATDPRWAGASWYGPTTGEYWIVNPREYADPRKHGPGYSSRVRTGDAPTPEPLVETVRPDVPGARRTPSGPPGSDPLPADSSAAQAGPPDVAETSDDAGASTASAASAASAASPPSGAPIVDVVLSGSSADPLRRLGLVLLAWPPIGIAAAAFIGELTGCSTYSTTCAGTNPFLPWLAQAVILGLLLLAPLVVRVLSAGTLGLAIGLVPATALVIALGGARSSAAGPVLGGVLVVAWLAGVSWGIRRRSRSRQAPDSGIGR